MFGQWVAGKKVFFDQTAVRTYMIPQKSAQRTTYLYQMASGSLMMLDQRIVWRVCLLFDQI